MFRGKMWLLTGIVSFLEKRPRHPTGLVSNLTHDERETVTSLS